MSGADDDAGAGETAPVAVDVEARPVGSPSAPRPRRCRIGTPPSRAPFTAIEDTVTVEQRWELARRYLGHEGADGYIGAPWDVTDRMCAIHIRPEHWLTRDYTKAGE